jgi:lactate racemase
MYAASMNASSIRLPYGSSSLSFDVPPGWRVEIAETPATPRAGIASLARAAILDPVSGPRLGELAGPEMRITIVVPDATRACPTPALLDALWRELGAAGVREANIRLLIALGMHRRLTGSEVATLLGEWATRSRVEQASGDDVSDYRDLGSVPAEVAGLSAAIPVRLHRLVFDCDLLIAVGLVEPHQLAGFSGGRKTVAIGCASSDTIGRLHGPLILEDSGTRLGKLEGNPLHAALEWIAQCARLRFVINVAEDGEGNVLGVACGPPRDVLRSLVRTAEPYVTVRVPPGPYDAVFAGVPPSKDVNLYQATRAQTYVAFAREPLLREEGWIVSAAACEEGAGGGAGETEFYKLMQSGSNAKDVLTRVRTHPYRAGGQRALLLAKALVHYRLMMVGMRDPDVARRCHVIGVPDATEAMNVLVPALGADARVLVVPNALGVLPVPD